MGVVYEEMVMVLVRGVAHRIFQKGLRLGEVVVMKMVFQYGD